LVFFAAFVLSVKKGQYDDAYTPSVRMLFEDELVLAVSPGEGFLVFDFEKRRLKRQIENINGVEFIPHAEKAYTFDRGILKEVKTNPDGHEVVLDLRDHGYSGASARINTLHSGIDGYLWMGSDDNSIHKLNTETGELQNKWLEGEGPSESGINLIYEIGQLANGDLYLSTFSGVYRVTQDMQVTKLEDMCSNIELLGDFNIPALTCTSTEVIIGTSGNGVLIFNPEMGLLTQYGRNEGMQSLHIAEMQVDQEGGAWIATKNGLHYYHSSLPRIRAYNVIDGLRYYDLSSAELSLLEGGDIIIGYNRGFGHFIPSELKEAPVPEKVKITGINGNGTSLSSDTLFIHSTSYVTPKDIERMTISFQALAPVLGEAMEYKYRLLGHEDNWNLTSSSEAYYSNLSGGEYVFEVKAITPQGQEMASPTSLRLSCPISWYKTTWFKVLSAFLSLALLFGIFQWRVATIRKQARLKSEFDKRIAEVEMSALRAQMNPHFLFNCLNSIKYFIIQNDTDQASE
ncbi:MAG: cbb3-type cytochrome oxidase assembly protein CcoS, partial [Bacteroidota bacterium]